MKRKFTEGEEEMKYKKKLSKKQLNLMCKTGSVSQQAQF